MMKIDLQIHPCFVLTERLDDSAQGGTWNVAKCNQGNRAMHSGISEHDSLRQASLQRIRIVRYPTTGL